MSESHAWCLVDVMDLKSSPRFNKIDSKCLTLKNNFSKGLMPFNANNGEPSDCAAPLLTNFASPAIQIGMQAPPLTDVTERKRHYKKRQTTYEEVRIQFSQQLRYMNYTITAISFPNLCKVQTTPQAFWRPNWWASRMYCQRSNLPRNLRQSLKPFPVAIRSILCLKCVFILGIIDHWLHPPD